MSQHMTEEEVARLAQAMAVRMSESTRSFVAACPHCLAQARLRATAFALGFSKGFASASGVPVNAMEREEAEGAKLGAKLWAESVAETFEEDAS